MLSPSYRQRYLEFLQVLQQLGETLSSASNSVPAQLRERFQAVKAVFGGQIANLTGDELDPADLPRWQSCQTESYRLMKLLEMDLMFLQASRQAQTATPRIAAMTERIKTLIGYCEALLQKE